MRRRRFTCHYLGQPPEVVLAHKPPWNHRKNGSYPILVEAGDHRYKATNWQINQHFLAQAKEILGLELRVVVRRTGRAGGRHGCHFFRLDRSTRKPYHHITVKKWLTPEEASFTLWHELSHAMQAERASAGYRDFLHAHALWRDDPAKLGSYATRPIEVEANCIATKFSRAIPLASTL